MPIALKPGTRLFCAVSTTEMITIRAPSGDLGLTIGGVLPVMNVLDRVNGSVVDGHGGGAAIGKRYVDANDTVELLCTKPGVGVPAIDGVLLVLKHAKALPASD